MNSNSEKLPGGIEITEGERRVALNRPWQGGKTVKEGCSLCASPSEPVKEKEGWIAILNRNPVYPKRNTFLLLPRECRVRFEPEKDITAAYDLAAELIPNESDYWMVMKQGGLAGQSEGHAHFHFIEHEKTTISGVRKKLEKIKMPRIFGNQKVTVCAGGHRAGQCFVLPRGKDTIEIGDVAHAFEVLVRLGERGLRSDDGLPPEYQITLNLTGRGIRYGTYLPILYGLGVETVALLEGRALRLPWSHEETAKRLRSVQ